MKLPFFVPPSVKTPGFSSDNLSPSVSVSYENGKGGLSFFLTLNPHVCKRLKVAVGRKRNDYFVSSRSYDKAHVMEMRF